MITNRYCTQEVLELFDELREKARMNLVFCGEPGVGKTEGIKFFSQYIPANERVITIEIRQSFITEKSIQRKIVWN